MVGALPCPWIALVRVADNAQRRLIDRDLNPLDRRWIGQSLRMLVEEKPSGPLAEGKPAGALVEGKPSGPLGP